VYTCKQDIDLDPYGDSSINEGGILAMLPAFQICLRTNLKCQKLCQKIAFIDLDDFTCSQSCFTKKILFVLGVKKIKFDARSSLLNNIAHIHARKILTLTHMVRAVSTRGAFWHLEICFTTKFKVSKNLKNIVCMDLNILRAHKFVSQKITFIMLCVKRQSLMYKMLIKYLNNIIKIFNILVST
jgi:hypothetical protein